MGVDYFKIFWEHIERELKILPRSHQLSFAASCCERAYPNYVIFFHLVHWGGPGVLRASLNVILKRGGGWKPRSRHTPAKFRSPSEISENLNQTLGCRRREARPPALIHQAFSSEAAALCHSPVLAIVMREADNWPVFCWS